MDLVDIIEEKKFIGADFITWLWWKSDTGNKLIELEDGSQITLSIGGKMRLESDAENVVCAGSAELHEAKTALQQGKKPETAMITIDTGHGIYSFVFVASMFEFNSISLPKTAPPDGGENESNGMILERIYLFRIVHIMIEDILHLFLKRSTLDDDAIRAWVAE